MKMKMVDGFGRCRSVCVRAVKGGGVFLLDGGKSCTQVTASGVLVRFAVPFVSWLEMVGCSLEMRELELELKLTKVFRRRHAKRKKARKRSPKLQLDFQHGT